MPLLVLGGLGQGGLLGWMAARGELVCSGGRGGRGCFLAPGVVRAAFKWLVIILMCLRFICCFFFFPATGTQQPEVSLDI